MASSSKQQAPTPQSPFGSGSGARFRMPADYARRGINRGDALQAEPRDLLQEEITMATSEVATVQREFAEQFGEGRVDLQHAEDGSRDFTATTVEWFASADSFTTAGKAQEALCARWADVLQDDEQEEGHEQDILIIFTQWGRHILPSLTQDWQSGYAEAWGQKQLFMRWCEGAASSTRRRNYYVHKAAYVAKRRQAEERPHREVRRGPQSGPQYHRGSHRQVHSVQQPYLDCDGWHARWKQARLHGEGPDTSPFTDRLVADPRTLSSTYSPDAVELMTFMTCCIKWQKERSLTSIF